MTETIKLELPWPPKELSPNARTHWAKRSDVAKRYRMACRVLAMPVGIKVRGEGKILLALEFVPPDKRHRDDDNMLAAFKAGRDGLADAMGIDDNRFVTQISVSGETAKGGMVRVEIRGDLMVYRNVVAAVVRALASETINSAGGCEFDVRVQAAPVPGAISGREAAFLYDCMVHALLHKRLEARQWNALVAKYSTHLERKHDAIEALAKSVVSPAPERFRNAAVITWAMPKLPGSDGKRSINVLPAGWYEMANWDDDGKPESTLRRWRGGIRRDLEREVNEALVAAQEILDAEGLIRANAA